MFSRKVAAAAASVTAAAGAPKGPFTLRKAPPETRPGGPQRRPGHAAASLVAGQDDCIGGEAMHQLHCYDRREPVDRYADPMLRCGVDSRRPGSRRLSIGKARS